MLCLCLGRVHRLSLTASRARPIHELHLIVVFAVKCHSCGFLEAANGRRVTPQRLPRAQNNQVFSWMLGGSSLVFGVVAYGKGIIRFPVPQDLLDMI